MNKLPSPQNQNQTNKTPKTKNPNNLGSDKFKVMPVLESHFSSK